MRVDLHLCNMMLLIGMLEGIYMLWILLLQEIHLLLTMEVNQIIHHILPTIKAVSLPLDSGLLSMEVKLQDMFLQVLTQWVHPFIEVHNLQFTMLINHQFIMLPIICQDNLLEDKQVLFIHPLLKLTEWVLVITLAWVQLIIKEVQVLALYILKH